MGLTRRDAWLLAGLTLFWGLNWPVMKVGVRHFPPLTFRVVGMVLGLVLLAAVMAARRERWSVPRAERMELLRLTLVNNVLWFVLSIYGVRLLESGRAAILGYTMPVWAALVGIVLYRELPTRRLWAGLAAAAAGVALLLSADLERIGGRPLGAFLMLAAAACWGWGTHLMRRRTLTLSLVALNFWSLLIATVFCALLMLPLEMSGWNRLPDAAEWSAIVYNAVVVFGFCQLAWFRLATVLPPVASGLSIMAIPVVGLLSGALLLGEQPGWRDAVALGCVLLAMAMVLLPSRARAG